MNENAKKALEEYRDKVKRGLIDPPKRKTTGLSLKRAQEAMCAECNGFSRVNCTSVHCPLHAFSRNSEGESSNWFMLPKEVWVKVCEALRIGKSKTVKGLRDLGYDVGDSSSDDTEE